MIQETAPTKSMSEGQDMRDDRGQRLAGWIGGLDEEMSELFVLLPRSDAAELERVARSRDLKVGPLVRRLIREQFTERGNAASETKQDAISDASLAPFETAIQVTPVWLKDVRDRLEYGADRHRAYRALRAGLHALRDRLSVDQVAGLSAQLPMLVRGLFFEGWHPHGKPLQDCHPEAFLAQVAEQCGPDGDGDPERIARAVFEVLDVHVSAGELESIKRSLPPEIRALWV